MVNRYINCSERTTALAEGIYLWAVIQNMPMKNMEGSDADRAWNKWKVKWGQEMTSQAVQEQYNLFDRVNNRDWS